MSFVDIRFVLIVLSCDNLPAPWTNCFSIMHWHTVLNSGFNCFGDETKRTNTGPSVPKCFVARPSWWAKCILQHKSWNIASFSFSFVDPDWINLNTFSPFHWENVNAKWNMWLCRHSARASSIKVDWGVICQQWVTDCKWKISKNIQYRLTKATNTLSTRPLLWATYTQRSRRNSAFGKRTTARVCREVVYEERKEVRFSGKRFGSFPCVSPERKFSSQTGKWRRGQRLCGDETIWLCEPFLVDIYTCGRIRTTRLQQTLRLLFLKWPESWGLFGLPQTSCHQPLWCHC